jgi:hypothetical protein
MKRDYDSYLEYEEHIKELQLVSDNLVGTNIDKAAVLNEENLAVSYDNLSKLEKKDLLDLYNKRNFENSEYRPLRRGEQFDIDLISLYLDKNDNIVYDSSEDPDGTLWSMLPRKIDMRYIRHVHVKKKS